MIKFNLRGNTSSGGKALIRLGLLATIIAIITTSISLYFYHASGDIYIDRSRPGFLPEKHENSQIDENLTYRFSEDGSISAKISRSIYKISNQSSTILMTSKSLSQKIAYPINH